MNEPANEPTRIPEEIRARLARATIRLTGSVELLMVENFFNQLLPVLHLEGPLGSCRRVLEERSRISIMVCGSRNGVSRN